jgi:hypothetical protein
MTVMSFLIALDVNILTTRLIVMFVMPVMALKTVMPLMTVMSLMTVGAFDVYFISDALHTVMSIGTQSMSAMSMMALNTVRP